MGKKMSSDYVVDALTVAAAIIRQVQLWQRAPVDLTTEAGREVLAQRHAAVRQFMQAVQIEAEALRHEPVP